MQSYGLARGAVSLQRILVVEDYPDMQKFYDDMLRQLSRKSPLEFFIAGTVPKAREILGRHAVDFIILDWMMPGVSGLDFIKELRAQPEHKDVLVIMVTAKSTAQDCAEALYAGADDFLSKPFNGDVLLARLHSLARRKGRLWEDGTPIVCGDIRLDPARGEATVSGKPVRLPPKGLHLLELFLRRPNVLHSAASLWESGWGTDTEGWHHILVATISHLKKMLGPKHGACIKTRRGLGYIFEP